MTMPPAMQYTPQAPNPSRTSKAAVTSLVCGIAFCIPVAPLLAVIFGFVGIAKTSNPAVKGRTMAIIGLLLGFLCIAGWGVGGYVGYQGYKIAMKELSLVTAPAHQFEEDITAGRDADASTLVSSAITPADVTAFGIKVRALGTYRGFRYTNMNSVKSPGSSTITINGIASFATGDQPVTLQMDLNGPTPKIQRVEIGNDIVLAPTP